MVTVNKTKQATNPYQVYIKKKHKDKERLSQEELLDWVKDQNSRRGGFLRIFPSNKTWKSYSHLLDCESDYNELLVTNLFKSAPNCCDKASTSENIDQYERILPDMNSKERKLRRRRMRRKKSEARPV